MPEIFSYSIYPLPEPGLYPITMASHIDMEFQDKRAQESDSEAESAIDGRWQ